MKYLFTAAIVAAALIACNSTPTNKSKQAAEEITQADKNMSLLAAKEGFNKALLTYA